MRQYTTPDQTAKLIELGFEKPKSIISAMAYMEDFVSEPCLDCERAYSIGELIEMLPEVLAPSNDTDLEMPLNISTDSLIWVVEYNGAYETASVELIDALYDMIVKLKEEGVI